ncbi:MAG: class I SAM-dependent methyltransferase [Clostridia bacterium]|nr:class I SAM-dependent methyltransferase [Clostridia bacterium]
MVQYQDFAYIYDRLMHEDIDYDKWCDYIENLFTLHGVSPDTLCELACGTGNMTCRMERRGYEITASDISSDMLSIASEKLEDTELVCSDMSKLELSGKYDAFLCMIDGLNYVITPKAVINTFKNVKKHLNDDGVFVFDVSSLYKLKNILGNETFIHSDYDVFYSWQNRFIEKYNFSDMLLNFFVRNGDMYERFEERHLQRGWGEDELTKMLKIAGFTEISVYNELTFDKPSPECERIVFVCK